MALDPTPIRWKSLSNVCLGITTALSFLGALWFQRASWPFSMVSSWYVELRIREAASHAPADQRTIVVLFRASECGAVLEQLAGASSLSDTAATSVQALVMSDVDINGVRELLRVQQIFIPIAPIDPELTAAFMTHHGLRRLPVAFEIVGDSMERVSLRTFNLTPI